MIEMILISILGGLYLKKGLVVYKVKFMDIILNNVGFRIRIEV